MLFPPVITGFNNRLLGVWKMPGMSLSRFNAAMSF